MLSVFYDVEPHLPLVMPYEWLARLRSTLDVTNDDDGAVDNHALRMVDFFTWVWMRSTGTAVPVKMDNAMGASRIVDQLVVPGLLPEWWLQEWMKEFFAQYERIVTS